MIGSKKSNLTQPIIGVQTNPHGSSWTKNNLVTIINIKLRIRTTPPQIRANL